MGRRFLQGSQKNLEQHCAWKRSVKPEHATEEIYLSLSAELCVFPPKAESQHCWAVFSKVLASCGTLAEGGGS